MSTAPASGRISRSERRRADHAGRVVSASLVTVDSPFQFN
jgi:hypothetical protein